MDLLTFITEMTKALAWPVVLFSLALLFRRQVVELIRNIKKGKIGPAEFEFESAIKELESVTPSLPPQQPESENAEQIRLAVGHPRAAVLEAWMKLEDRAINLALSRGIINATARRYAGGAIRQIRNAGLLKPSQLSVLEELQYLRNQAAHNPDFSPTTDSVIGYIQLAETIGRELDEIPR